MKSAEGGQLKKYLPSLLFSPFSFLPILPPSFFLFFLLKGLFLLFSSYVVSDTFVTPWIVALQAPRPWGSPGKNTAVGCHFLLQGIFLTQGSDTGLSCLLHWQVGSLPLASSGKPEKIAGVLSLGQDAAGNFPG